MCWAQIQNRSLLENAYNCPNGHNTDPALKYYDRQSPKASSCIQVRKLKKKC